MEKWKIAAPLAVPILGNDTSIVLFGLEMISDCKIVPILNEDLFFWFSTDFGRNNSFQSLVQT